MYWSREHLLIYLRSYLFSLHLTHKLTVATLLTPHHLQPFLNQSTSPPHTPQTHTRPTTTFSTHYIMRRRSLWWNTAKENKLLWGITPTECFKMLIFKIQFLADDEFVYNRMAGNGLFRPQHTSCSLKHQLPVKSWQILFWIKSPAEISERVTSDHLLWPLRGKPFLLMWLLSARYL